MVSLKTHCQAMYYNVLQSSTITITFFGVSVARLHKLLLYVCLFPAIIRYVYSNGVFYLYLNVTRVVCDDVRYKTVPERRRPIIDAHPIYTQDCAACHINTAVYCLLRPSPLFQVSDAVRYQSGPIRSLSQDYS